VPLCDSYIKSLVRMVGAVGRVEAVLYDGRVRKQGGGAAGCEEARADCAKPAPTTGICVCVRAPASPPTEHTEHHQPPTTRLHPNPLRLQLQSVTLHCTFTTAGSRGFEPSLVLCMYWTYGVLPYGPASAVNCL
jgi:hypothetical protein